MPVANRRELLKAGVAVGLAAGLTSTSGEYAAAIEPPQRVGGAKMKVGCCAYSYRKYLQDKTAPMPLKKFLEICATMNMDGVELTAYYFPNPLSSAELNALTRHAYLLGLEVTGSAVGNTFTLPTGEERNKQIAYVKQWIEYTADMGGRSLRIFAGSLPKGVEATEARKWVVECVQECLPLAEKKGVIMAMENHHGVVPDANTVFQILDAIKSDWFGFKWDSGNFQTPDPFVDLTRLAKYAVTTHIKTEMSPGGKKQEADLSRFVKILREASYRGYLLLEYEAAEDPMTAVPKTIATLQKLAGGSA